MKYSFIFTALIMSGLCAQEDKAPGKPYSFLEEDDDFQDEDDLSLEDGDDFLDGDDLSLEDDDDFLDDDLSLEEDEEESHTLIFITQEQPKVQQPLSSFDHFRMTPPDVEFKMGYFFFSDSKMRKIYDQEGLDLQLAGSYPIWKCLQVYGSVEYMEKQGRSLHDHQRTRIWEYPISLGLKTVITVSDRIQYFFTIGPRYFFIHQHNNSAYIDRKINHNGLGGFLSTGFNYLPYQHCLIGIFGEYSYKRMHCHFSKKHTYEESAQVGGFTFGGSLGYLF